MQVSTGQREIAAEPGSESRILVKVVNTGNIIDGLSARVVGAGSASVRAEPAMLPLFPEAEGEFALTLDVPDSQPAGRHPLTVEVVSHTTGTVAHADVDLEVPARPLLSVVREPRMIRTRRTGRFVLAVGNRGNVPLDVTLASTPGDAGTTVGLNPIMLRVDPGTTTSVMAKVRGPRLVTGAEVERNVGIEVVARPADAADSGVEPDPVLTESTSLQLRQRPLISRGLLTFLILAAVVGLWAAVFLFGLINVFASDPLTKTAPASFFGEADLEASAVDSDGDGRVEAAAETGEEPPVGALPKEGLMPPGVGGQISGTVTANSDGTPVGRILVTAYRTGPDGRPIQMGASATQSDGSYTLAGLFPTSYLLKFSARGHDDVWYGARQEGRPPEEVTAEAQTSLDGVDVVISGRPGSISGVVDPGDTVSSVPTRVSARLLSSSGDAPVAARTTTDSEGGYTLTGLDAPGTYEISFLAPGYRATSVVQRLAGGEDRIQPKVLLSSGEGQISGVVNGDDGPLGGVTVTTTVDGSPLSVITPTTGIVGAYSLQSLPTPGTYVVTFSADGYGERVVIVDLGPGESRTSLDQSLTAGTGSITGVVRGPDRAGLGGVEVVVGGAITVDGSAPTTTTVTSGAVGSFAFSDLTAPGDYTLTFTAPGFAPETRPVRLEADGPASKIDLTLTRQLGSITGAVVDDGKRVVGVPIIATNGLDTLRTTSSAPGGALSDGGYLIPGLDPGW
jgi:hypothetical protein